MVKQTADSNVCHDTLPLSLLASGAGSERGVRRHAQPVESLGRYWAIGSMEKYGMLFVNRRNFSNTNCHTVYNYTI